MGPRLLNKERLKTFGQNLQKTFGVYEKDRKVLEDRWLRALRQFRGIYDPEVKIPSDSSNAYPKLTRRYVIGTVARLMEMLFPQTEKNWAVDPSPIPDLSAADTQKTLDMLAQSGKLTDTLTPEQANDLIETEIRKYAKVKSDRMSRTIEDQLAEMDFVTLARRVVFSGALYGVGMLQGPFVKKQKTRKWQKDPVSAQWTAVEVEKRTPIYDHLTVWEWYPDLSAKTLTDEDGYYVRQVMSRSQVRELAERPDFLREQVLEWLANNTSGNYKSKHWETAIRERGDKSNVTAIEGRKYEVLQWWGFVSGHDLAAAGVTLPETKLSEEYESNVWFLGDTIIKAVVNPMQTRRRPRHDFIYEEDDINLAGIGVPEVIRDTQLTICDAARMLINNCSVSTGVQLLIRTYLLAPKHNYDIHANKLWFQDTAGEDGKPAVENIQVNGHIEELLNVIRYFTELGEQEVALPPPALGDPTKGGSEALRTMGTASMLFGAAALPIRNTVRNFDRFTLSFIQSLIDWNMQFNPNEDIKGDHQPIARGSTSLIAKEVRAQSLDYLATTLQPEERIFIKGKAFLEQRMKARDLPFDELLEDNEVVKQRQDEQAALAAKQLQLTEDEARATIRKLLSEALKNVAMANKADVSTQVETFKALMESLVEEKKDDAKQPTTA